jgi:hypothetical protein
MFIGGQAAHNGVPGGHADGAVRIGPGKAYPVIHEPIEMGRPHLGGSQGVDRIETLLVGGVQDNVGFVPHFYYSISISGISNSSPVSLSSRTSS